MPLWPWTPIAVVDDVSRDGKNEDGDQEVAADSALSLSFEVSVDDQKTYVWLQHDTSKTTWRGEAEAIGGRLSPEDVQWLAQYTPLHPNEQYHWDWEELPRTKISVANLYHKEVIWMNPRNRTAKLSLRGVRWPESLTAAFTMRLVLKLEYPQFDGTNTTDASRELCYCFEMSPLEAPLLSPEWIPSVMTAQSICSSFADSFVNWEITKEPSDGANVTVVEDGVRVDDDGAYEITIVANGSFLTSIDSRLLTPRSTRTIGGKTLAQYRTKLTKNSVVRVLMVEANDDESSPACVTFRTLAPLGL
ncbi:hypothetical protein PINS_up009864 [Pythium insidiosum]|nr:hypothetical protein PINS_up009864 [Pythium insidiosum]